MMFNNTLIEAFQKFRISFIHRTLPPSTSNKDSLAYWRANVLFVMISTALILGSIVIVPSVLLAIRERVWGLAVFDIAGYFISFFLFFSKGIRYELRAGISLLMFYLVGVMVIVHVGPLSGGPIWLFTFTILVGLLLGTKIAIAAIVLNGFALAIIGWLIATGQFGQHFPFFRSNPAMVAAVANFLLLNLIAVFSVSVLVKGLVSSHEKEKDLTHSLEDEQAHLIEAKNKLEREIEERKHAEIALKNSEEKYRLLADNITDNIWVLDLKTMSFSYVSPSVTRILGYSAEETLGLKLEDILLPSSLEHATRVLSEELMAESTDADPNRSRILELEQYHKNGSVIWTEVAMQFIRDENGSPTGILGVTRNVTERRRLQDQLHKSQKMESLGLMASGIAHDLNNILLGIVSYPDLLLLDLPEDSPLRAPIKEIRASGKRAADVVSDLLTVARGIATKKEVLSLNAIVQEYFSSAEHLKIETMNRHVTYEMRLDPDLLNTSCSPTHIKKSLLNLVSNASESIEEKGKVTVSTMNRYLNEPLSGQETVQQGEYAVLTISDSGIGISPDDLERIFEPFYTKKEMGRSGTGLGLAVVWSTVQDHSGYVHIKSDDRGSSFTLYFPVTRDKQALDKEKVPLEDYLGNGETILVVDDEKNQRDIACGIMSKLGYTVKAVSSGEEAICYLKEHSVDLLILDMIMPNGINGRETYEEVIKIHPNQKAIIASGLAPTDDVMTSQALGAGAFINKPYTMEKIGLAVKNELMKTE